MRRLFDRLRLRLRALTHAGAADAVMRREIQDHLDELTAEYRASGLSENEARAAARRAFGSTTSIEEQCREARRVAVVENLWRDVRYTARALTRQPLLVLAATLSIGVATAASTVIYTLTNELLLAPPSARQPGELAYIELSTGSHVSYPQFRELESSGALAGLAGYQVETSVNWTTPERAITLVPLIVTGNFFDVLGVPVAMGRGFTAREAGVETDGGVTVVSHAFWRDRLGSDPSVLGRVLTFNGRPYSVVGVLPPALRTIVGFGLAPEVYLPLSRGLMPALDQRRASIVQLVGRLHPGQSLAQGRDALDAAVRHAAEAQGEKEPARVAKFAAAEGLGYGFKVIGIFFVVLAVAVGLVLAIACANVAGLLLSRGLTARREIAMRAALGAGRGRLVQQLLVESFWIALIGTTLGVVLARAGIAAAARIPLPVPIPLEVHAAIDGRFLLMSLFLLAATTMLSGLAPALQSTRLTILPALKQEEPVYGRRRWTLRRFLVVGQVAVAVVLLLTAILFLRNLSLARHLNPGFDTARTVVIDVGLVEGRYSTATRAVLLAEAVERLRALPGVASASYSHGVPLTLRSGTITGSDLQVNGSQPFNARYSANFVGPGYFSTLGIPLVRGREFQVSDGAGAPRVAIVNQAFADRHLAGIDPVGQTLLLPGFERPYPVTIVGVVANSKYRLIGEEQMAAVFEPYVQRAADGRFVHLLVRTTTAGSGPLPRDIEGAVRALDPTAAVEARPMQSALAFAFLPSQFGAAVLGTLGLIGLILAMVGLYATIAYTVARRTGEIGVRVALGASRASVLRVVAGDAALVAGVGALLGLAIAAFVTRPLGMFLVAGLDPGDPASYAGTTMMLVLVCVAATVVPARRALRVDPVRALKAE